MRNERFASVWDAIEGTPEERENLKLRLSLMPALKKHLVHNNISQARAAQLFGVTQPHISDLISGKISLFPAIGYTKIGLAHPLPKLK